MQRGRFPAHQMQRGRFPAHHTGRHQMHQMGCSGDGSQRTTVFAPGTRAIFILLMAPLPGRGMGFNLKIKLLFSDCPGAAPDKRSFAFSFLPFVNVPVFGYL